MGENVNYSSLNDTGDFISLNNSNNDNDEVKISLSNILIGIGLLIIVLITIVGNVMVLLAVYLEKRLRTTFNYYIVNLAVTDLAVAVTAMSFYTISNILGYWPFGGFMCGVWIFFDYGMTFVSVFTLLLISIDRFWSVTWYIHYRQYHNEKTCLISIAGAWLFMLVLWLPPCIIDRLENSVPGECKWEPSLNPIFVIIVATLGHHGSCAVLLFCYIRVFICMQKQRKIGFFTRKIKVEPTRSVMQTTVVTIAHSDHSNQPEQSSYNKNGDQNGGSNSAKIHRTYQEQENDISRQKHTTMSRRRRDSKVFVTLTYIIVGYVICWVPFHFVFDISCIKDSLVPESVFTITFWMTYVNSTINPILYNFSSQEFREAFLKILSRRR